MEEDRRLYAGAIAMYRAPVWARRLAIPLDAISQDIVRGGDSPSTFSAPGHSGGDGCEGLRPSPTEYSRRSDGGNGAESSWRAKLSEERYARRRVVGAILLVFEAWMHRRDERLTYRLTQVITWYGCCGDYVCRIGRKATASCFNCRGAAQDSTSHTLADCPAWHSERRILVDEIAQDLSLSAVVSAMLSGFGDSEADDGTTWSRSIVIAPRGFRE
ncbi:uncharacterized protein [Battus philenor]|uniref:uncharacterized protein n=1 Tax=Battus philenor TaxID=42288 RepID=UPI0035CFF313